MRLTVFRRVAHRPVSADPGLLIGRFQLKHTACMAVEAYGVEETIRHCKGMFAIALFDKQTRKLTLIRDRGGEQPL